MAKETKKGDFSDIDNLIRYFKKLEKKHGKNATIDKFIAGKDGIVVDIRKKKKK